MSEVSAWLRLAFVVVVVCVGPRGPPFLDKTLDPLLSVSHLNVVDHLLFAVFVRRLDGHLALIVEKSLATLDDRSALRFDAVANMGDLLVQFAAVGHAFRDQATADGLFGVDRIAGQQHVQRLLLKGGP